MSKNKNIDHRVKEICAVISTQVTYETDQIYVLCCSTMSSALNFCFYVFYCDLKGKYHIRRNINCKKRKVCEISIIILVFYKLGSVRPVQQKINWPSPYEEIKETIKYSRPNTQTTEIKEIPPIKV